jgi:cytochrome c oxidase subunit III
LPDRHSRAEHYPGPLHTPPIRGGAAGVPAHHPHHPKLQHHFDDMDQQLEASTLGMWVFLVTEIMFFGGLFTAYLVYRWMFQDAFQDASSHLNKFWGAVNTIVLIVSSLTMAMAVRSAQIGAKPKVQVGWLVATMVFGTAFLGVKVVEYVEKFTHHLVPGPNFQWPTNPANANGAEIFYSLYFCMTGLHALHMIIGLGLMTVITIMAWRGKFDGSYYTPVEISGLYWHFVDIVWIFLFPLLYLIGAHFGTH